MHCNEVHAKWPVRHCLGRGNFSIEQVWRHRATGDHAETARIRDGGGERREADIMHAALHDRVLHAEHFGDAGLHGLSSDCWPLAAYSEASLVQSSARIEIVGQKDVTKGRMTGLQASS